MRPDHVGLGGFDSHTLPPARAARRWLIAAAFLIAPAVLHAQRGDSTRIGVRAPRTGDPTATGSRPPITPRRAFLYSLLLPGAGQAKLDRARAGAGFFLIEGIGLALAHRSAEDYKVARAFRADSVPLSYRLDPTTGAPTLDAKGLPLVATWSTPYYTDALIKARKLHYEDWISLVLFNHIIAGADAYVAAQLWDLPVSMRFRGVPGGALLSAAIRFR